MLHEPNIKMTSAFGMQISFPFFKIFIPKVSQCTQFLFPCSFNEQADFYLMPKLPCFTCFDRQQKKHCDFLILDVGFYFYYMLIWLAVKE